MHGEMVKFIIIVLIKLAFTIRFMQPIEYTSVGVKVCLVSDYGFQHLNCTLYVMLRNIRMIFNLAIFQSFISSSIDALSIVLFTYLILKR
jgi:hypothetical protein